MPPTLKNPITFIHVTYFVFTLLFANHAFGIESKTPRKKIVSQRSKKFYNSKKAKSYLAIGGIYSSDYNSKNTTTNLRYLFQSNRWINEALFENEVKYSNLGSSDNKQHLVKKSELYDLTLSSKYLLKENGRNYALYYHRTIYDDLSKFYYDTRNAIGLGRNFHNNKAEIDFSIGYRDVKNYGNKIDFIPSIRTNFKLSKNLRFKQRGHLFIDNESIDSRIVSRLVYKISNKLSFEIRNTFEQRRYEDDLNQTQVNQTSRRSTIGLIFDLD